MQGFANKTGRVDNNGLRLEIPMLDKPLFVEVTARKVMIEYVPQSYLDVASECRVLPWGPWLALPERSPREIRHSVGVLLGGVGHVLRFALRRVELEALFTLETSYSLQRQLLLLALGVQRAKDQRVTVNVMCYLSSTKPTLT